MANLLPPTIHPSIPPALPPVTHVLIYLPIINEEIFTVYLLCHMTWSPSVVKDLRVHTRAFPVWTPLLSSKDSSTILTPTPRGPHLPGLGEPPKPSLWNKQRHLNSAPKDQSYKKKKVSNSNACLCTKHDAKSYLFYNTCYLMLNIYMVKILLLEMKKFSLQRLIVQTQIVRPRNGRKKI